jgi:hypothetical protein
MVERLYDSFEEGKAAQKINNFLFAPRKAQYPCARDVGRIRSSLRYLS